MSEGRSYKRMSVEDFGRRLIETGDLDPLYIALHKAELPPPQLARWLVAYWCLYHAGAASWLSEQPEDEGKRPRRRAPSTYRDWLREAAENRTPPLGERWPRGAERRHWRGEQARKSALGLFAHHKTAEALVEYICYGGFIPSSEPTPSEVSFFELRARVLELPGFGPWIAFKVGDMIDRLGVCPVSFREAEVFMFDDPRQAALKIWRTQQGYGDNVQPKDEAFALSAVIAHYAKHFRDLTAPPLHERAVGIQEIETVFCKWKSHMNGHYPLMKDTHEIRAGLEEWAAESKTAGLLAGCMPGGAA